MQGNCSSEPSGSFNISGTDIEMRSPGQCVLITDVRLLRAQQFLWLDNLYIRHRATERTDDSSLLDCLGSSCNMWITTVTIQGEWNQSIPFGGVGVGGGQMFAEGAHRALTKAISNLCSFKLHEPADFCKHRMLLE
jgi:hypothetical protein